MTTRSRDSINIIVNILKLDVLPHTRFVVIEERKVRWRTRTRNAELRLDALISRAHVHRNWRTRYIQGDHNPSLVDS